jgi:hypothetical protein
VLADTAEARLAALRREEADLRARLAELEAARRDRAGRALAPDLALRAGADLRWEVWVGARAAEMTAELARLLARLEGAKAELRREAGRRAAVQDLLARERAGRAAKLAKAEERRLWEGG